MYSRGTGISYWFEWQGRAGLFDFSFARLTNALPSMHVVKQHEYKAMCIWPYSHSPHLSSPFSPPIKLWLIACASTEQLNAVKSRSGKYDCYIFAALPVPLRAGGAWEREWPLVVKSPCTVTVKINGKSLDVSANDSGWFSSIRRSMPRLIIIVFLATKCLSQSLSGSGGEAEEKGHEEQVKERDSHAIIRRCSAG